MVTSRRNIKRHVVYALAIFLFLIVGVVLFPPLLVLSGFGFAGAVVMVAVMMALKTARWASFWVALSSGLLWLAATIVYWTLWGAAFEFADANKNAPEAIQSGSLAALAVGVAAFVTLVVTAIILYFSSGKLPKG